LQPQQVDGKQMALKDDLLSLKLATQSSEHAVGIESQRQQTAI
jgi:hypothetical protein